MSFDRVKHYVKSRSILRKPNRAFVSDYGEKREKEKTC